MKERVSEQYRRVIDDFTRIQERGELTSLGVDRRTGYEVLTDGKALFWKNGHLIPVFASERKEARP